MLNQIVTKINQRILLVQQINQKIVGKILKNDSNGKQRAGFEGKKMEFLNRKTS